MRQPERRVAAIRGADPGLPTARLIAHQRLVGEALRSLLQATGELAIAPVETVDDAGAASVGSDADVILLDLARFDHAERRLVERLGPVGVRPPVVLLVGHLDVLTVQEVMRAGVEGVLDRGASAYSFVMAVKQVLAGQSVFPAHTIGSAATADAPAGLAALSERQRDVLRLIADGCSNDEIGRELYISVNTVKFHVREIFRKLGLHNRVQAARRYAALQVSAEPRTVGMFDG